jgi:hypothetical protein
MDRLFKGTRAYLTVLLGYVLLLASMIRQTLYEPGRAGIHPSLATLGLAVGCIVILITVFGRTANAFERAAIALSAIFSLLWGMSVLTAYGYHWAAIPYNLLASTVLCAVATAIAGLRAIQVHLAVRHDSK